MPIQRQHRWLYPLDWAQISAMVRFERAKGRCQCCSRPHGQTVFHLGDGRWWDAEKETCRDGRGKVIRCEVMGFPSADQDGVRQTRVFLATAHLDHDPTNNRPKNLKAFCQRCHLLNDAPEHRRRRHLTIRA